MAKHKHVDKPGNQNGLEVSEGRVARRRRKVRDALVNSARVIMSEKGLDGATMIEIAEQADVGAGTIYNYFRSKDDLAVAVLEEMMHDLALRIEAVTSGFEDPAQVYAFGVRTVLETAMRDIRWKQLLNRSEVISDALVRRMGSFAIRDLEQASMAGRIDLKDGALVWRMAVHAIVGISLSVTREELPDTVIENAVVHLLCMAGLDMALALELASRPRPSLPAENA